MQYPRPPRKLDRYVFNAADRSRRRRRCSVGARITKRSLTKALQTSDSQRLLRGAHALPECRRSGAGLIPELRRQRDRHRPASVARPPRLRAALWQLRTGTQVRLRSQHRGDMDRQWLGLSADWRVLSGSARTRCRTASPAATTAGIPARALALTGVVQSRPLATALPTISMEAEGGRGVVHA